MNKYSIEVINELNNKPNWLNIDSPQINQFDLIIGWDTEYYNNSVNNILNNIVSYQFCIYDLKKNKYLEIIIYPLNNQKKTLSELIIQILKNLNISQTRITKKKVNKSNKYLTFKILLVAHYSISEWSMLDKRNLIAKHLNEVQGTIISFRPFNITVDYKKRKESIEIFWSDTYLFTDSNNKTLESISNSNEIFNKKIEIPAPYTKDRMDILFKENKELFKEYAISDARITLEYYCNYICDYYKLSNVEKIPFTIGYGSVEWYLKYLEEKSIKENRVNENNKLDKNWWSKKILGIESTKERLRQITKIRGIDERFVSDSYLGAINTSYYLGKFQKEDYLIFDIDLSSAYPTSLAVIPAIDWDKTANKRFNIREWLELETFKQKKYINLGVILLNDFEFNTDTFQTSIPIPDDAGLIYVRKGNNTFVTYPEIITSFKQDVKISNEHEIETRIFHNLEIEGEVVLAFADFIKFLVHERKKYLNNSIKNIIFKLSANTTYGKLGQGIKERHVYNLNKEKKAINHSKITVPHYASSCTSLIRCCLIDLINHFHSLEGFKVLNATTDGLMVAIHKKKLKEFEITTDNKGIVITKDLKLSNILPNIYKDLSTHYSIRNLIQGRKNLDLDIDFLEIKHIGDLAHTWKTRLNCIVYKGITQHIAKGGIDKVFVKTYEDLLKLDENEEITTLENVSLTNVSDMIKYKCDLVKKSNLNKTKKKNTYKKKKINLDYDYKRFVLKDGIETRTFEDLKEWIEHRTIAKNIRKINKRSTFDLIELSKKDNNKKKIKIQGTLTQTVLRVFLDYYLKNKKDNYTYQEIIDKLNKLKENNNSYKKIKINENLLKKCKTRKFYNNCIPDTTRIRKSIIEITKILEIDNKEIDKIQKVLLKNND